MPAQNITWMKNALCKEVGPNDALFFPKNKKNNKYEIDLIKKLCSACLVTAECLNYALTEGFTDAAWGGLTQEELRKLQKKVNPDLFMQ